MTVEINNGAYPESRAVNVSYDFHFPVKRKQITYSGFFIGCCYDAISAGSFGVSSFPVESPIIIFHWLNSTLLLQQPTVRNRHDRHQCYITQNISTQAAK